MLHCIEQLVSFYCILDIGVDQKGISLGMDVFHRDLEPVEKFGLRILYFCYKVLSKVFVYDPIACSKEGQHVRNKMSFAISEVLPIGHVLSQVDFFRSPEASLCFFVILPDVIVMDGEKYKATVVLF